VLAVSSLQRVCVFCGSANGADPGYRKLAIELGEALAAAGVGLVYGGAHVGLMGIVADAALARGGEVIGVIPGSLREREIAHTGLTELIVVDDMHARKRRMYDLSDGFCALPGGYGTLDEIFEATTWSQLGLHAGGGVKPVVLLDHDAYWAPLASFLDGAVASGFVRPHNRALISHASSVAAAIGSLEVQGETDVPIVT
jgi:uncharacterized protein (TIGR00730 family)